MLVVGLGQTKLTINNGFTTYTTEEGQPHSWIPNYPLKVENALLFQVSLSRIYICSGKGTTGIYVDTCYKLKTNSTDYSLWSTVNSKIPLVRPLSNAQVLNTTTDSNKIEELWITGGERVGGSISKLTYKLLVTKNGIPIEDGKWESGDDLPTPIGNDS